MKRVVTISGRATARELLAAVLGPAHADHTAVRRTRDGGRIVLHCSCGESARVLPTEDNKAAVRNVSEAAS